MDDEMLKITENKVQLTRGDTAVLKVEVQKDDGSVYELKPTDTLVLTIKANTATKEIIIQKAAVDGVFTISAPETEQLAYGYYYYDVELRQAEGFVSTIIPPHSFMICEEVTF